LKLGGGVRKLSCDDARGEEIGGHLKANGFEKGGLGYAESDDDMEESMLRGGGAE